MEVPKRQKKYYSKINNTQTHYKHYELELINEEVKKSYSTIIKRSLLFLLFLLFIDHGLVYGPNVLPNYYPETLGRIELAVTFYFILWKTFNLLVSKNKINVYYKKSYIDLLYYLCRVKRIVLGIVLRATTVLVFSYFYIYKGGFISAQYGKKRFMAYLSKESFIIFGVLFILSIYFMYYKEPYITSKDYSDKMRKKINEGKDKELAHNEIINENNKKISNIMHKKSKTNNNDKPYSITNRYKPDELLTLEEVMKGLY